MKHATGKFFATALKLGLIVPQHIEEKLRLTELDIFSSCQCLRKWPKTFLFESLIFLILNLKI